MRKIMDTACVSLHWGAFKMSVSIVPILWTDSSRVSWDEEILRWWSSLPFVSNSQHRAFDVFFWREIRRHFLRKHQGRFSVYCVHVYGHLRAHMLYNCIFICFVPCIMNVEARSECMPFCIVFQCFCKHRLSRLAGLQAQGSLLFLPPSSGFTSMCHHPDLYMGAGDCNSEPCASPLLTKTSVLHGGGDFENTFPQAKPISKHVWALAF